jgi:antirestriction protein ArdC
MRNLRSHPTQRRDHYQELTDKIVAALEAGIAPWRRPWDPSACGGSNTPVNVATGHRYRGVNLFVLSMSPLAFTSGDPRWFTLQSIDRSINPISSVQKWGL